MKNSRRSNTWALACALSIATAQSGASSTTIRSGNDAEVARLLGGNPQLALASDERRTSALMFALYGQRMLAADLILARRGQDLTIFEVATAGKDDVVRLPLERDPRRAEAFSSDGFTALHLASFFGRVPASGAEPKCKSDGGCTPLHEAAATGQLKLIRLLLRYQTDTPVKRDDGRTPADTAARDHHPEMVDFLRKAGR